MGSTLEAAAPRPPVESTSSRHRGRYPRPPMMDHRTIMGFQRDEAIRQRRIDRVVMRRVWHLHPPVPAPADRVHRRGRSSASIATALPPLLVQSPHRQRDPEPRTARSSCGSRSAPSASRSLNAALSLVQRYYSARIGEGLIYDLRVEALRPRAAHADRVLHPHADGRAAVAVEQRRRRRATSGDRTRSGTVSAERDPARR